MIRRRRAVAAVTAVTTSGLGSFLNAAPGWHRVRLHAPGTGALRCTTEPWGDGWETAREVNDPDAPPGTFTLEFPARPGFLTAGFVYCALE